MTSPGKLFMFFDTETNAVGRMCKPVTQTLMQLAWVITDEVGNVQHTHNKLVKGATYIGPFCPHTLTIEHVNRAGEPPRVVLDAFIKDAERVVHSGGHLVAHNAAFDVGVLEHAHGRELPSTLTDAVFCTMKAPEVVEYCNLTTRKGTPKWPKLSELYMVLFDAQPSETLHDALGDTHVLRKSFHELVKRGVLPFAPVVYISAGDASVLCGEVTSTHPSEVATRFLNSYGHVFGVESKPTFDEVSAVELGKRERAMFEDIDGRNIDPDVKREAKRIVSERLRHNTAPRADTFMKVGVVGGVDWGFMGNVADPVFTRAHAETHARLTDTGGSDGALWDTIKDAGAKFIERVHELASDKELMSQWNQRDPDTRVELWNSLSC